MKKTIQFIAILISFIAISATASAQCSKANVHNNTNYDMYVTIYDQCGQNTGAVLVPKNSSLTIPMPIPNCAMLSGNIYYPPGFGNPCAGNHPICPPSSSPCTPCAGAMTVTTTITPLVPSGCEYDIDII